MFATATFAFALNVQSLVMKLSYGLIGYLLCATAVVALGVLGSSYAVAPDPTTQREATKKMFTPQSAIKPVKENGVPNDPNRVPVWIIPTQKYPASAFTVENASRAKEMARGDRSNDWRLRERRPRFDGPTGMSAYADGGSGYRESMQFRERTEPR